MKALSLLFCTCLVGAALAGQQSVTLSPETAEVLIEPKACETVRFAADEMTNALARVFGAAVPVVTAPTKGKTAIVLGENKWSKEAGLDPSSEPRDTFFIKAAGDRIYIVGHDDRSFGLLRYLARGGSMGLLNYHERGTIHGVYAFLETYAGVRYYWPDDELGVVFPRKDRITVPEGQTKTTPEFLIRSPYFNGDGTWYTAADPAIDGCRVKARVWMRLRLSSFNIPCCHGIRKFNLRSRFGKTHPEFFVTQDDHEHLCWSNPELREIIYQDVKKRLLSGEKVVDIMPDDGFKPCQCARCQAAYEKEKGPNSYAVSLIWGFAAEVGRRLQAEGVEGSISMMSYSPYSGVPEFDLSSNIRVMVAVYGPWSLPQPDYVKTQYDLIRAWKEKTGAKVWIWTYPNKHGRLAIDAVPQMAPHAWSDYYRGVRDAIFGAFAESESDNPLYNYLNYYVFSRTMWDASVDVDAIVAEHDRLLYGPAASEMHAFNAMLEEAWTKRVAGTCFMDEKGPVPSPPCSLELWTSIYDQAFLVRLDARLSAAAAKVRPASLEARRIALMRREFYEPLKKASDGFRKAIDPETERAWRAAHPENVNLLDGLSISRYLPEAEVTTVASTGQYVRATASMLTDGARRLKPNTRYRISLFLKLDDVRPTASGGGVSFVLWDTKNNWFPRREEGGPLVGTTGWFAQQYEITTDPDTNSTRPSYFRLHMRNATGRFSFNSLRIDELPAKEAIKEGSR